MDTLSRLIDLARPQASLDLRCLLSGGFDIDHAPTEAGTAPFHLVLDGACVVETASGEAVPLRAGDFMLFPRGASHRLRDVARSNVTSPLAMTHDGMLPVKRNGGVSVNATDASRAAAKSGAARSSTAKKASAGGAQNGATLGAATITGSDQQKADLDLLCGRFVYSPGSSALLLNALPDPLHVSLGDLRSMGALQTVITLMRTEAERRQAGALAIVTALSQALFAMALRVHGEQHASASGVLALLADARLGSSVQGMLNAPERAWTIAELGELSAMSRATYARHFAERSGMTVMDFLTQIRMTIASDLLRRTQRSVAEIGESVGYQSEAAFGKAFQQSVGLTPGRYRRQPQEGETGQTDAEKH